MIDLHNGESMKGLGQVNVNEDKINLLIPVVEKNSLINVNGLLVVTS